MNILLLGETGTGKSTWINGFANYVRFDTVTEAEAAGGSFPISANFIANDPVTYEDRIISTDKHVRHSEYAAGESVTQEPRTYCFTHGGLIVNLIDTPGFSDTKDTDTGKHEKDKQHVDDILHFVGRFDKLHAICILLKPNQTRITEGFAYCITEILRNLHESACNNVIFIITNVKSTDFTPGRILATLRDFFHQNSLTKVKVNPSTVYCFENDTMQHIVEYVNECPHNKDKHCLAEESWKKSSKTTMDMLTYIQGLAPHDVDNTQCIYNTRCLISILSKVLFDIVKCITTNTEQLASKKEDIRKRQSEIQKSPSEYVSKDLWEVLYTEVKEIEYQELKYSITICTSPKCSDFVGNERHFKQICCTNCWGFWTLWTCTAFAGISGRYCKHCNCERSEHRWTTAKTELKKKVLFDVSEEGIDKILSSDDAVRHLKDHCDKIENYVAQSEKERDEMLEVGALLSMFLQTNVLFNPSSSDNLGSYLNNERDAASEVQMQKIDQRAQHEQIPNDEEQRKIVAAIDADIFALSKHKTSLSNLIKRYEDYYKTTISSGRVITMVEAQSMVDDLYRLPRNGKTLKEAVAKIKRCQKLEMQHDKCKTAVNIPAISKTWRTFVSKFK